MPAWQKESLICQLTGLQEVEMFSLMFGKMPEFNSTWHQLTTINKPVNLNDDISFSMWDSHITTLPQKPDPTFLLMSFRPLEGCHGLITGNADWIKSLSEARFCDRESRFMTILVWLTQIEKRLWVVWCKEQKRIKKQCWQWEAC